MTTGQVMGRMIAMMGYRKLLLDYSGEEFVMHGGEWEAYAELHHIGPTLLSSLKRASQDNEYLRLIHWPTNRCIPTVYLFLGGDGDWLPLDHQTIEEQMKGTLKRFNTEIMSVADVF